MRSKQWLWMWIVIPSAGWACRSHRTDRPCFRGREPRLDFKDFTHKSWFFLLLFSSRKKEGSDGRSAMFGCDLNIIESWKLKTMSVSAINHGIGYGPVFQKRSSFSLYQSVFGLYSGLRSVFFGLYFLGVFFSVKKKWSIWSTFFSQQICWPEFVDQKRQIFFVIWYQ